MANSGGQNLPICLIMAKFVNNLLARVEYDL